MYVCTCMYVCGNVEYIYVYMWNILIDVNLCPVYLQLKFLWGIFICNNYLLIREQQTWVYVEIKL